MTASFAASDEYYAAIEAAILETPRGRWFLREHARRQQGEQTDQIIGAINHLKNALSSQISLSHVEILRRELQEMSHSIVQTRQEIAAIKPADAGNNRIMVATEELDAIVTATERATSDILTAAERLATMAEDLSAGGVEQKLCEEVANLATSILMACSFQDITGQRTTKVVHVLRYLEQRVNAMIEIWGVEGVKQMSFNVGDTRADAHLISGPPREGEGIQQDDVDRLMSGQTPVLDTADVAPDRPAPSNTKPQSTAAGTNDGENGEEIDQSEIDRLFA